MFTSLIALDGFHLLLSIQLTADLPLEWSGGFIFHPLSSVHANHFFCCDETIANNALNRRRVVVFRQQLSHWQMSIQNIEYTAFWYLPLLCYQTQLQFTIDQNEFGLWFLFWGGVSGTTAKFERLEVSVSYISVRPRLKSAYQVLTIVSDRTESQ